MGFGTGLMDVVVVGMALPHPLGVHRMVFLGVLWG